MDCPLGDFTGRCVRKGKAVFVEPDLPHLKRWLFIPPHARNGVKEGDYVRCAILRHPIRDGKPQAKVLALIGDENTPGIENLYSMAKYRLAAEWSGASREDLDRTFRELEGQWGRLDILVNNAGIAGPVAPVDADQLAQWARDTELETDAARGREEDLRAAAARRGT